MAGRRRMGRNGEDPVRSWSWQGRGWSEQAGERPGLQVFTYCTSTVLVWSAPGRERCLLVILLILPGPFVVWCHIQLHRRPRPG